MVWGLQPKMYHMGTTLYGDCSGGCMRASRWGLYEKYLAQNNMKTVKVYFSSGQVID